MPTIHKPLGDAELNELDELLLSMGEQLEIELGKEIDSVISASELDGFFTALISGSELVMPSEWLPAIWGGQLPTFKNEKQFQQLMDLLMRHMNDIASQLLEEADNFEPLFEYHLVDNQEYEIVDEWCRGYLRGIKLREAQWQPLLNSRQELFIPLKLFGEQDGWDALAAISEEQQEEHRQAITGNVITIYQYWLAQRTPTALAKIISKTGRN